MPALALLFVLAAGGLAEAQLVGGPQADPDSLRVIDSDGGTVGAAPDSVRGIDTDGGDVVAADAFRGIDTDGGDVFNLESLGPGVENGMDKFGAHIGEASNYAVDKFEGVTRYTVDQLLVLTEQKAQDALARIDRLTTTLDVAVLGNETELGLLGQLDYANGQTTTALNGLTAAADKLVYTLCGCTIVLTVALVVFGILGRKRRQFTPEAVAEILAARYRLSPKE